MRLLTLTQQVLMRSHAKFLMESPTGTASDVQSKMFALGKELKKDGEDVTDDEVQAAMLSALIDANGKIDSIDVSDVESISKQIKESRGYLAEGGGLLHTIEAVGTILGNTAFIHALATGLHSIGFKNVDESQLKAKLEKGVKLIKNVTGFPAKVMEKAFSWIAKKLGVSITGQKVAGISGILVMTLALLALAIYLFPSVSSGILLIFSISGMVGKSVEIVKLIQELYHHIGDSMQQKGSNPAATA